jgi:hypothetical protein
MLQPRDCHQQQRCVTGCCAAQCWRVRIKHLSADNTQENNCRSAQHLATAWSQPMRHLGTCLKNQSSVLQSFLGMHAGWQHCWQVTSGWSLGGERTLSMHAELMGAPSFCRAAKVKASWYACKLAACSCNCIRGRSTSTRQLHDPTQAGWLTSDRTLLAYAPSR